MELATDTRPVFSGKKKMNDMTQPTNAAPAGANSLWAIIGVLGVVVIALASALYFVQTREVALRDANINGINPVPVGTPLPATGTPEPAAEPEKKKSSVSEKHGTPTSKPASTQASRAGATPAREGNSGAAAQSSKPACLNCGTVTAVTPVEREGAASGTGAVAGGVLGAIVGNQVGRGQGKDVATILGAIGGGVAGNAVEKKMKKETVYQVQVRLDDGSTRSFEQAEPVGLGVRVRVEGEALQVLAPSR